MSGLIIVLVVVAVLIAAGFGLWRWAMANHPVALLDRVDSVWTGGDAELVGEPISFGAHPQQRLFVFRPSNTGTETLPVLIFIHGGGWQSGDPEDYAFIARNLAPEGMIVVNAGYRLGPDGKFPAMLEDGAAALSWVASNIAEYGGDPDAIYLAGHSAGAYNAAMLALDLQWLSVQGLEPNVIKGVVGLAGPYDFLPLDGESVEIAFGDAPDKPATQPINFVRSDAPPMLLSTGTADTTVFPRNSRRLAQALQDAGNEVAIQEIDGMSHEGIIMALSSPFKGDGAVKQRILAFMDAHGAQRVQNKQPSP